MQWIWEWIDPLTRPERGDIEAVSIFGQCMLLPCASKAPARFWLGQTICISFHLACSCLFSTLFLIHRAFLERHSTSVLERCSSGFSRALCTPIRLDEKGEYFLNLQQSESAQLVNCLDGV